MAVTGTGTSFRLGVAIHGIPPEHVYRHMSNPQSLLGLQPLLVSVEGAQHHGQVAEATAGAHAASAQQVASADQPAELEYEAVERFSWCWGLLELHNRIHVRQQLLGRRGLRPQAGQSAAGHIDNDAAPLQMRFLVTSPPWGLVAVQAAWTFSPAAAATGATAAGGSGSGGTHVALDVSVEAPWLLRCALSFADVSAAAGVLSVAACKPSGTSLHHNQPALPWPSAGALWCRRHGRRNQGCWTT